MENWLFRRAAARATALTAGVEASPIMVAGRRPLLFVETFSRAGVAAALVAGVEYPLPS